MKHRSRAAAGRNPTRMDLKVLLDEPPWDWPRDAGERFRDLLADRRAHESDRLVAAQLAGDLTVMNDELAKCLMAVVRNGEEAEGLRTAATISLGPVLELAYTNEFGQPDDLPINEETFQAIQRLLHDLFGDAGVPKEVRQRILEAAVRAPQKWQREAIGKAYASGDPEWLLTAVFSMRWVRGFDAELLEALKNEDADIAREAIYAAANWELKGAWPHVVALVKDAKTPKPLLLAAIAAVGSIGPTEASQVLRNLARSRDEDIAEAVSEAVAMAELTDDEEDFEIEDTGGWIN